MPGQEHIIKRQVVEFEFFSASSEGYQLQQEVSRFANETLQHDLEQVLDSISSPDIILHFDQITLHIQHDHTEIKQEELAGQIRQQLKQKLMSSHSSALSSGVDDNSNNSLRQQAHGNNTLIDHLFYFIVHGQLQWNAPESIRHDFVNTLSKFLNGKNANDLQQQQFAFLMRQQSFRKRLVWQFNNQQLLNLIAYFKPAHYALIEADDILKKWLLDNRKEHSLDRERFYAFVLASEKIQFLEKIRGEHETEIKEVTTTMQNILTGTVQDEVPEGSRDLPDMNDSWYIENAGLVLLHPFLNTFFTETGIVQAGKMVDANKGMILLQYLAAFQEEPPEHVLVLNKVICGIPIEEPVKKFVMISDKEKAESISLLKAIISHWHMLGNTSVENLQGSFLCRNGKLSIKTNGDWYLQVERKGWDLLLDQIPWSYSIIAFPWMQGCIWVEW